MPVGATIGAVSAAGAIGSAAIGASAAKSAAKTQANAATNAANLQLGMFNTIRSDLSPYRAAGGAALPAVYQLLGLQAPANGGVDNSALTMGGTMSSAGNFSSSDLAAIRQANPGIEPEFARASAAGDKNSPVYKAQGLDSLDNYTNYWYNNMRNPKDYTYAPAGSAAPGGAGSTGGPLGADATGMQAFLAQTPGYQFQLQQGQQAIDNSMLARGLGGVSGALGKGLAKYVTGLADSTYQQQLGNYMGLATMGQNAAVQTGAAGTTAAGNAGTNLTNAGTAAAGGTVGAANALSGGLSGLSNSYLTSQLLGNGLYGGGGVGGYGTQGTMANFAGDASTVAPY